MRDAEWTLEYPGGSLSWGAPGDSVILDGPPEVGSAEIRADDADLPRADGIAFGQDFRGGVTITFPLAIVANTEKEARDLAASFKRAWRGDSVRGTPGEVATLRSRLEDRKREVFGRPRRFAQDDEYAPEGVILLTVDFQCVNDLAYAPDDTVETVPLVPPPSGGMTTPLAAPLTTTAPVEVPGGVEVGGDVEAWPVVEVFGPITDPTIQVTNEWSTTLRLTIPDGDSIVLDSRPWKRTVLRSSDGASFAGAVRGTPLSRWGLEPGGFEVSLRGTDQTGTSSMRFSWRDTYTALS